ERAPERQDGRAERGTVWRVAAEHYLTRRHQRKEGEQVSGAPPGRVEEQIRVVGGIAPDPAEVADSRVGEDDPRVREPLAEVERVAPERGDSAPGVNDHRHPALVRYGEDRLGIWLLEAEVLGARVKLDAARARIEAALRLA